MTDPVKEKRLIPRAEVRFPTLFFRVKLHATFSNEAMEGDGTVVNLSTGGCKIESHLHVRHGGYMAIRLYIPDQDAPIRIDVAAVRWIGVRKASIDLAMQALRMHPKEWTIDAQALLEK